VWVCLVVVAGLAPALTSSPAAAKPKKATWTTVVSRPNSDPLGSWAAYLKLMTMPQRDTGIDPGSRAPRETGRTTCPKRRCVDSRLKVPKRIKVNDTRVRVLLPRGYHNKKNAKKRYPVIFLWNGARSSYEGWTWKSELIRRSRNWKAIFVMPAGGLGKKAGMMSDWVSGEFDWESFHTKVVVPWVDKKYRTIKGARASIGASMGALGVFNYAAHNPGMFKAGLSISGSVDITSMATNTLPDGLDPIAELLGMEPPGLRQIWGDPVLNAANWADHNPTMLAPKLKGMKIFLTSGTGFYGQGSDAVHSGTFELTMWNMHRTFLAALHAAGVAYTANVTVGGVHDWRYFNEPLTWGVPKLIRAITPKKKAKK